MNDLVQQLLKIAREAAIEVMEVYERPFEVDYKGPCDPVTEADRRANDLICTRLEQLFPGVPIVAEESPEEEWSHYRSSDQVFFVDPVDGTREFVARNGQFVIMIGLLEGNEPTHGALYAPAQRIGWGGAVRSGAFEIESDKAPRPLQVRDHESIDKAKVVASRSYPESLLERSLHHLAAREIVPIGSAGLKGAAVARNQADIYLAPERAGCRWDSCAPEALIRAAGGIYTDARGERLDYRAARVENDRGIIASAPHLHELVVERLKTLPSAE